MLKLHVIKAIGEVFVSSLFICNIGDGFPKPKHCVNTWVSALADPLSGHGPPKLKKANTKVVY